MSVAFSQAARGNHWISEHEQREEVPKCSGQKIRDTRTQKRFKNLVCADFENN